MRGVAAAVLAAFLFVGCAAPRSAQTSVETGVKGLVAYEKIVVLYHGAVMETFEKLRASLIRDFERVVEKLEADDKLTAEEVKKGVAKLAAKFADLDAKRDKFMALKRLADENGANSKDALWMASDMLMRMTMTAEEIADQLSTLKAQALTISSASTGAEAEVEAAVEAVEVE